ncbi:hypothetical protein G9A89_021393 [Geosiphon pyriformis]|nr:hypothetical protein G9A89_021393 [Geosiphon pyriformis]
MGGGLPLEENSLKESMRQMSDFSLNASQSQTQNDREVLELGQVRLIHCKSKVYVHPTSSNEDNIPGFLCIVEKSHNNNYIAWTPESLLTTDQLESYVQVECYPDAEDEEDEGWQVERKDDRDDENGLGSTILISPPLSLLNAASPSADTLYAASTPISSIYSIVVLPPKITNGYGSITINLDGGTTLPTFWFHDDESRSTRLRRKRRLRKPASSANEKEGNNLVIWGGDETITWLRKFSHVFSSSIEPNLFLINPSPEDMTNHSPPLSKQASTSGITATTHMDPLTAAVKEIRFNVLERFSRVARFSRDTAATILEHPLARPILPHLPPVMNSLIHNEPTHSGITDFDSARMYLAQWAALVAKDAEAAAAAEHGNGKDDASKARPAVWRVGELADQGDSSTSWQEETELGAFEILSSEASLPPIHHTRTGPLKADTWFSFFDVEGRLLVQVEEVRAMVFRGGVEEDIRVEVWKFFLGVFPWESSQVERENIFAAKSQEYWTLKREWWDSTDVQDDADFQEQKNRIEKDVIRTDRTVPFFKHEDIPHPDPLSSSSPLTNKNLELMKDILMTYNFYNKNLGYVQGMSDLLAPIFVIMGDEVAAFWAFTGFMDRMKSNFYRDQSGMRRQLLTLDHLIQFMDPKLYKHLQRTESLNLFCCFRWLIIWFKREFKWDEVTSLWEVLWSDHLTGQFHLFFALAILDKHRQVIMDYLTNFDEILKYINDLSMTIQLEETLQRAETLYYQYQRMVEAVDRKRLELEKSSDNQNEDGPRMRKGKEIGEDGSSEASRLPVITDLLRGLLSKEYLKE